jgi:folate-binding protein YgfZ
MSNLQFKLNLNSYTFIDVVGNDAHRFLQGQMTVNADNPKVNEALLASLCNPKGRIVSLFHISKVDNGFRLFLPKSIATNTQLHLKKYAVFFKVDISLAKESTQLTVIKGSISDENSILNEPIRLLGTNFSIQVSNKSNQQPINNEEKINESFWYKTLAENKIPWLTKETSEQFLPHNLNLPDLNAIDFKKGCFTGQEVIARMQYKGKLKQHIQLLKCEQIIEANICESQNKILQENKKVGEIICSINHEKKCWLLVLLKDSVNSSNSFNRESSELTLKLV